MTTIQEAAREAGEFFTTKQREGGESYVTLKDARPDWVYEMVREAHGEMLPDDWRYATIEAALEFIAENDDADGGEFADLNVDTYNGDRFAWLASHIDRQGYVNEGTDELGHSDQGISGDIGIGQYVEGREVFESVRQSLEDHASE